MSEHVEVVIGCAGLAASGTMLLLARWLPVSASILVGLGVGAGVWLLWT